MLNVQALAASCVAEKLWPAMVRVALRALPVLAAAVTLTDPLPVPLAGLTVAHPAGDDAVQVQDGLLAVTDTLAVPPAAEKFVEAGSMLKVQPDWVTVNDAGPAVIEAVCEVPALAATVQLSVPFPVPLPPDVMLSHPAEELAVQAQDWSVTVTLTEPLSPAAGEVWVAGENDRSAQFGPGVAGPAAVLIGPLVQFVPSLDVRIR